jgi:hypothetical protein
VSSTWSNEYLLLENRQKSYNQAHSILNIPKRKKMNFDTPDGPLPLIFFTKLYIHHTGIQMSGSEYSL